MKKLISLTLSIMMIMSLVAVPVSADETAAPVIVTPTSASVTPAFHISADSMRASTNNPGRNEELLASNYQTIIKWKTTTGAEIGGRSNATYIYDAETADPALTAWEGFKVVASGTTWALNSIVPAGAGSSHLVPGISVSTNAAFDSKGLRADSVRFKLPEQGEAANAGVILFGAHINKTWYEMSGYDAPNALRIINGGAKTIDMSDPANGTNWTSFIEDGTIQPNKWYRAERILDMRIDDGIGTNERYGLSATRQDGTTTTTENWQRFIVYEEHENGESIVGDSGWVFTSRYSHVPTNYPTRPSDNTTYVTVNYPEGACVYFDDIKAWAVDTPMFDTQVGSDTDVRNKWLTFPTVDSGKYRENKAVGVKFYSGALDKGDATTAYTTSMGLTSDYIYMQESFMIPEVSNTEIGLLDLAGAQSYNTCGTDWGAGYTANYNKVGGVVRIKKDATTGNAVLTVKEWDGVTDFDTAGKSGKTGYYNDAINVPLKNGNAFALPLTTGKWYKATVKIDQSMHLTYGAMKEASAPGIKQADDTYVTATDANMTKATVIIEDSEGNVYETKEFNWKSPNRYLLWAYYGSLVFADGRRAKVSTDSFGYKINLDDIKFVLSDGAIDDESAKVIYSKNFDNETTNAAFSDISTQNGNFQNVNATIAADVNVEGIPSGISFTLEDAIIGTNIASAVKLYKGDIDVTRDHVTSATYDAETKKISIGFSALFPFTEYKVAILRGDLVDIEADIFAAMPGNAKELAYTFTTGASDESTLVFTPNFVAEGEAIDNRSFAELDGYRIYAPYADLDLPMATIRSYNDYETGYVAIAALYDNEGRMEDMISETGVVPALETINVSFGFDPATEESGYLTVTDKTATLKAFIWNTWTLMDPFGETYIYPPVQ